MESAIESFKQRTAECFGESEIDELCIEWLKLLCKDCGSSGETAAGLLDTISELLAI